MSLFSFFKCFKRPSPPPPCAREALTEDGLREIIRKMEAPPVTERPEAIKPTLDALSTLIGTKGQPTDGWKLLHQRVEQRAHEEAEACRGTKGLDYYEYGYRAGVVVGMRNLLTWAEQLQETLRKEARRVG